MEHTFAAAWTASWERATELCRIIEDSDKPRQRWAGDGGTVESR
jgi:hypothetical protein